MSRFPMSRQTNRVDFLAGSERLLRVHRKNSVFSRDLQHSVDKLDVACRKNLSKFQQTIFDVYHNEFVPIREEANALRLPKLALTVMNVAAADRTGIVMPKTYNERLRTEHIKEIHRSSSADSLPRINDGTFRTRVQAPCYGRSAVHAPCNGRSAAKHAPSAYTLKQILELPPAQRQYVGSLWKKELDKTILLVSDPDIEDSSCVDSETLQRIKNAIALTSQPSKSRISEEEKMLRKSFLLSLRRTSRAVWHSEMLQRVYGGADPTDRQSGNDLTKTNPSRSLLREEKLAKLLMLSTSNVGGTSASLDNEVALTTDAMSRDGGRHSSHSVYTDRFQVRERTFGSDVSSDEGTGPESPTYFSEISEEPSFLNRTDTESDTSSAYSYSDSYDSESP